MIHPWILIRKTLHYYRQCWWKWINVTGFWLGRNYLIRSFYFFCLVFAASPDSDLNFLLDLIVSLLEFWFRRIVSHFYWVLYGILLTFNISFIFNMLSFNNLICSYLLCTHLIFLVVVLWSHRSCLSLYYLCLLSECTTV